MKFLMNGCLLVATADGSAVEIAEEIGAENMVSSVRILLLTPFHLMITALVHSVVRRIKSASSNHTETSCIEIMC